MGDLIQQREQEIIKLHEALQEAFKKSVMAIVIIGRHLTEVKEELDHGQFLPWLKQRMPFTDRTAARYMRVYEQFKDVDEKSILQMAVAEAYVAAGIRKMIPALPGKQESGRQTDPFAEIRQMKLKGKSLSGLPLKDTRMGWQGDDLYIERKHIGLARKLSLFLSPHKDQDPAIFAELKDNLRIAFESYYFKVEAEEAAGRINYAPTTNFTEIVNHRRRDHTPSVPPEYLRGAGRKPRRR